MKQPPFLTINEFRDWSRLGRTKIYELLDSGDLKAVKFGRKTLISGESAQAWVDAQPAYRPTVGAQRKPAE